MGSTSKILRTNFLSRFGLVFAIGFCINCYQAASDQMWVMSMFTDMPESDKNLLPDLDDAYGVVFRDINKDNQPDIYVVRFRDLNRLFINQGKDRPFIDRTIESGLGGNLASRGQKNLELGASAVDFDNDGTLDILIAGWDHTTRLPLLLVTMRAIIKCLDFSIITRFPSCSMVSSAFVEASSSSLASIPPNESSAEISDATAILSISSSA